MLNNSLLLLYLNEQFFEIDYYCVKISLVSGMNVVWFQTMKLCEYEI